ncbi:MAG TPA: hypothetical protein VGO45_10250, partial [Bacteroidia bacterium]|nr:hypothetical protein [Bacteroidia bacterium]
MLSTIKHLRGLCFLLLFLSMEGFGQTTLYNENFGTTASLPAGWTSTTTAWLGSTGSASTTYTGASGGANAEFANTGTNGTVYYLIYNNSLSTVGYSSITVLWGARATTTLVYAMGAQWSIDGTTWNNITYTDVPSDNNWYLVNSGTRIALPAGAAGAANLQFRFFYTKDGAGNYRIDDFTVQGTASGPTSTLASSNPAVPAANVAQSSTSNVIYAFSTAITGGNMTINTVNFTTAGGTYAAADITKFQLWYSTTNTFASAAQIGSNITTTLGNGAHSFSGLTQVINSGTTGYFFITTDIAAAATVGNTIIVSAITPANLTFASGSSAGSASAGGTQTITAPVCTCTLPFTQNFDAAWTTPTTLITQTCAWSGAIGGAGNNSNDQWQRNDDGAGWTIPAGGAYSPVYTSASHSARFHTYEAPNNTYGDLITPQIDFSPVGTKTLTFEYINPEGTTLDVSLSTDGG